MESTSGATRRDTCRRSPNRQVVLDVAELLGQCRERPAATERVAGEVGELQEEISGPVRVGADERGDGGQGVEDEVRADLGPEST
jgi:hypothetical protein